MPTDIFKGLPLVEALPKRLRDNYDFFQVDVFKLGSIRLALTKDTQTKYFADDSKGHSFDLFISELYAQFIKSPHIMNISPSEEELLQRYRSGELAVRIGPYESALCLSKFIKLRVVLPERKRTELFGLFPWTWNPEEFSIWFNGSEFVVHAPTESAPVATNIGQIAREFLKETLGASTAWNDVDGIGPTPIHPEIYVISAKRRQDIEPARFDLPYLQAVKGNLVVVEEADDAVESVISAILQDITFALSAFYQARITSDELDEAIFGVEDLNVDLDRLLANYFSLAPWQRVFNSTSTDIRRGLAKMHSALQRVAEKESEFRRAEQRATKQLAEALLLHAITDYFREHLQPDISLDRESQIARMNFAAEETNNLTIIQATLVAAMIGAIIGGSLTIFSQLLLM